MRPLWAAAALAVLAGCATSSETDLATLASNSDQVIWEAGQKALEKKDYEGARQHYKRIIDGFPQSEHGPAARIALGDSYFREGGTANYMLAIPAYRDFLTLYPSHPRSDYAQLMIAESYWEQRNGPDRDQVPTRHALEEYQRLLELHPSSPWVEQARTRVAAARFNLARAEFLIGYFYQRTRQACRAAIPRYESVLKTYPDYTGTDEVLLRLGQCLGSSGRAPEALPHLARLLSEYPQSPWIDEARQLQADLANQAPAPPSAARRASSTPRPRRSTATRRCRCARTCRAGRCRPTA